MSGVVVSDSQMGQVCKYLSAKDICIDAAGRKQRLFHGRAVEAKFQDGGRDWPVAQIKSAIHVRGNIVIRGCSNFNGADELITWLRLKPGAEMVGVESNAACVIQGGLVGEDDPIFQPEFG